MHGVGCARLVTLLPTYSSIPVNQPMRLDAGNQRATRKREKMRRGISWRSPNGRGGGGEGRGRRAGGKSGNSLEVVYDRDVIVHLWKKRRKRTHGVDVTRGGEKLVFYITNDN